MSEILRFLLVEDSNADAALLEQYLRASNLNFTSVRVDNEKDYLAELSNDPDIIISDFSLPQFDGFSALRLLKSSEKPIPFILASGKIGEETAAEAIRAGACDYIMKDNLARIPTVVTRALEEARTQKNYRDLQDRYQKIVTLSPDAIFIQCEGVFVFANQAGILLLGAKTEEEIIGKPVRKFIHPDYHRMVQDRTRFVETNNKVADLAEEKFLDINENIVEVEVLTAPFHHNGKIATQLFVRNIMARKRSEEKIKTQNLQLKKHITRNKRLKYADLMKTEFLATMSHELRTPMNAIIGFSEVLRDGLVGGLTEKQKQYCTDIFKSGQHLLALINDILDLSKIDAGKMHCDLKEVEMESVLIESLSIVKERAALYNIKLKIEIENPLGNWNFDELKLNQIIYNLLSNAVKFSASDSTVTLRATVTNDNVLEISIEDQGEGISSENMKRLFRPFEQIRQHNTQREKGTGLGLMIAKRLIELHSGTINVESTLGKGTRFIINFPKLSLTHSPTLELQELTELKSFAPTALVVEDDLKAAELVGLQLKEIGIGMIWKSSAEEALEADYSDLPDVIILDIFLPGMSGIEMMTALKSHKVLSGIPIIIVSIAANENRSSIVNAVDILQKPLSRHQLADSIKKHLKKVKPVRKHRILVADDDRCAFEILKGALDGVDFELTYAQDGKDALKMVEKQVPDMIILDLMMPNLNGFEVLDRLKNHENTCEIPVIVVTSKSLSDEEQEILRANASHVMKKNSFLQDEFRREIKKIIFN